MAGRSQQRSESIVASVRFPTELYQMGMEAAFIEGVSFQTFVRTAVDHGLREYASAPDFEERRQAHLDHLRDITAQLGALWGAEVMPWVDQSQPE